MTPQEGNPYPPSSSPEGVFLPGERHLHSVRLRGYRYRPLRDGPDHEDYIAHVTDRRLILVKDGGGDPRSMDWNDIIEIRPAAGSRLLEALPGVEEHMLLIEGKGPDVRAFAEMFLFTAEPVAGAFPQDRPRHCAAFVDIVEQRLLEAFVE